LFSELNELKGKLPAVAMGLVFDTGKIVLTALIIFSIAQVSERSTIMAAVLASIPIVSVLSMMMMYHEGQSAMDIAEFSKDIVWLVIPSLLIFIVMPYLIESRSWDFYPALAAGLACTVSGYFLMIQVMERFGLVT
tara:strand:- start:1267 stop:1674 length:408 start_codon:yes stop_codon:yes gene_type:complete